MSQPAIAQQGHNRPPVNAPTEAEVMSDLEENFPDVKARLDQLVEAAKTYPATITDEETAGSLQALLKQMRDQKAAWEQSRGVQKRPWDAVADIVHTFFKKPQDTLDKWVKDLKPRHTAYLEQRAEVERVAREAKARKEREEADRLRREVEAAEQRKVEAERAEREAREREERLRLQAEEARLDQLWAEARAELAEWEERRVARERAEREKRERDANKALLEQMEALVGSARELAMDATARELSEDETQLLDDLILEGGEIGRLGTKLLGSPLLSDEQRTSLSVVRADLIDWRAARNARAKAKEDEAEAKARAEKEERMRARAEAEAAEREVARKRDEERARVAREAREQAEREAEDAKARTKAAKAEVREAGADARAAATEQKQAARSGASFERQAERTENRADRLEHRLETSTDADLSRVRGELGTTGSLSGHYEELIEDNEALVLYFGPLGPYLHPDAISIAVRRYMRAMQKGWQGERIEGLIPGVAFVWTTESRIA